MSPVLKSVSVEFLDNGGFLVRTMASNLDCHKYFCKDLPEVFKKIQEFNDKKENIVEG